MILSALVAHTSWHWMTERWGVLTAYQIVPPAINALFWAAVLRWVALLLVVGVVGWGLAEGYRRLGRRFRRG